MITALFLFTIVFTAAVISELFGREGIINIEVARKLLHFAAGVCCAVSVFLIESRLILLYFGLASIIISLIVIKFDILSALKRGQSENWGMFYLPLSFTLLVYFLFPIYKELVFISMLLLAISDALAALFGTFFTETHFKLTSDRKSFVGSTVFFFISFIIIILFFVGIINLKMLPFIFFSLSDILLFALTISFLMTVLEALSSKGFDNFSIPIFNAVIFYIFATTQNGELINQFIIGVLIAGFVSVVSIKFKFLTHNGSAATFLLAAFIFGLGGWKWSLPIMTFFILSSILSKIRKKEHAKFETYFEKSSTRDYLQVLANGGIGGVLVIYNQINPSELNYFIYLASMAAVCADTWATEIGTLHNRTTYNVLNFSKIEQGTSGGISIVGTFGAFLGSFIIALSGLLWVDINYGVYFLLIIGTGLVGSFFDSILGASIQLQSKCFVCKKVTEKETHCGEITYYYRGFKWLNNDAVNFFSSTASALFIILIFYFN